MELIKFFTPRAGRFAGSTTTRNANSDGSKKHQHLYDNTPLRAIDVATAGLMAGMTSPARPWFRLKTPDNKLNEVHAVKVWLRAVEDTLKDIFAHSNTYRAYRRAYESLVTIGTAADIKVADFEDVTRHYPLSTGEYCLGLDDREEVNTLYRKFQMSTEQVVSRFGLKNCSDRVKNMYNNAKFNEPVDILHGIEPRRERDPMKLDSQNMPWTSCYLEADGNTEEFLRVSGHRRFPGWAPRWKVNGHDAYGEAPAMRAIGDNKQLQQEQVRKSQAIDFQTMPPLQVPTSLADAVEKGPGGITMVDSIGPGIKSAWDVNLNLEMLLNDIQDVRIRINQALFVDMFLMFSSARRGVQPPTAEEIVAQKEEQLLMVGPVLENLHDEMLSRDIQATFEDALAAGILPPLPAELSGQPLVIHFVSTLAQAQRLIGVNSLDRMVGTLTTLSGIKPETVDKLDGDATVEAYADMLGVPPDIIVGKAQVALIRQQRAQQQAQEQALMAAPEAAKALKTVGDTAPDAVNKLAGLAQPLA
jgi:hypothetical protein